MLDFPRRNSKPFPITFWFSIRTFSRQVKQALPVCHVAFLLLLVFLFFLPFRCFFLLPLPCLFLLLLSKVSSCSYLAQFPLHPGFSCLCIEHHGPRSRSCFPSSPGSGHYASEPLGWSSSFLRTVHWMGRFHTFVTLPLGTSNIKRPPHVRSPTSVITSTHDGVTWRHPITDDCESWAEPTSFHNASLPSWGWWPHSRFEQWSPKPSSHSRTCYWSISRNLNCRWTSSGYDKDHGTSSCSVQTAGLINWGPTTEEETKINVGSRIHCHCKVWPPCSSSHHLRNPSRRFQLWWFRWWRSIRSCFYTWSSGHEPQLQHHRATQHHFHYTTRHFNTTNLNTESKSNHPHPSTKPSWSSAWPTISSLDKHRRSRADQPQTGHKVPSFVEDDRSPTSSWSAGVQAEMGNLETNGPTWSRSPASWTRGWGLNGIDIPFKKKKCAPAVCLLSLSFLLCPVSRWPFSSFLFFSSLPSFPSFPLSFFLLPLTDCMLC